MIKQEMIKPALRSVGLIADEIQSLAHGTIWIQRATSKFRERYGFVGNSGCVTETTNGLPKVIGFI